VAVCSGAPSTGARNRDMCASKPSPLAWRGPPRGTAWDVCSANRMVSVCVNCLQSRDCVARGRDLAAS
jgi:hypothetical protein